MFPTLLYLLTSSKRKLFVLHSAQLPHWQFYSPLYISKQHRSLMYCHGYKAESKIHATCWLPLVSFTPSEVPIQSDWKTSQSHSKRTFLKYLIILLPLAQVIAGESSTVVPGWSSLLIIYLNKSCRTCREMHVFGFITPTPETKPD